MIYLALAVIFLHIISLPLVMRTDVNIDSDKNIGAVTVKLFFIPLFKKRISLKLPDALDGGIRKESSDNNLSEKNEPPEKSGAFRKFMFELAAAAAKRVRVREMRVNAVVGTGDAAVTAMIVGSIKIAYSQVCALLGYCDFDGDHTSIRADYDSESIYVDFFGIFSLCFADIIYAVIFALSKCVKRIGKKRRRYANATTD